MLPYFAYGANMDEHHMHARVPGARTIGAARLDGYRLTFNLYSSEWEGGAANLEPEAGAHVWGVAWDVPDDELRGLDAFQGHPTFFRREEIVLDVAGARTTGWTYRVAHLEHDYVRPTDAYLNTIYSAIRVHGLPPEAFDLVERAARPPRPSIST